MIDSSLSKYGDALSNRILWTALYISSVNIIFEEFKSLSYEFAYFNLNELFLDNNTSLELLYFSTRFGSIAVSWRPTMCKPTKANLQDAWR